MAATMFSGASAQELVYEPINPSFGGNPFNSSHLLAIANAQNDYERPSSGDSSSSDLDRFVRSLQSRLLSSLSSQVANAIFGEDAQESGRIVFGDQVIEFFTTLDGIQLTITEADGSQTVITVPTLITPDSSGTTVTGGSSGASGGASGSIAPAGGGVPVN
jgi:curli production assembly/transport component CsgF